MRSWQSVKITKKGHPAEGTGAVVMSAEPFNVDVKRGKETVSVPHIDVKVDATGEVERFAVSDLQAL